MILLGSTVNLLYSVDILKIKFVVCTLQNLPLTDLAKQFLSIFVYSFFYITVLFISSSIIRQTSYILNYIKLLMNRCFTNLLLIDLFMERIFIDSFNFNDMIFNNFIIVIY